MAKKSLFRRALALVLCTVMLASCWVFTAPTTAVATGGSLSTETPVENYDIVISGYIDSYGNSYDRKFVGTGLNNNKDDNYKDQAGIVVYYNDENGQGSTQNNVTWDFGGKSSSSKYNNGTTAGAVMERYNANGTLDTALTPDEKNQVSTRLIHSSSDNGKTFKLKATISGFPTKLWFYNNNDHDGWFGDSSTAKWEVHSFKIGKHGASESEMEYFWDGCFYTESKKGGTGSGCEITLTGTIANIIGGNGNAVTDYNDDDKIYYEIYTGGGESGRSTLNSNQATYLQFKSKGTENSAKRFPLTTNAPYADSVALSELVAGQWPSDSALNIVDDSSSFAVNASFCKDQYGVKISTPTTTAYRVVAGTYDYASYGLTDYDLQYNETTGLLSAYTSGDYAGTYVAGNSADHTMQTKISYTFNGETADFVHNDTLHYPTLNVTWKYHPSDYTIGNAAMTDEWTTQTSQVLFGNTPAVPGSVPTTYYTTENHYSGGIVTPTRVTADTEFTMDYTGAVASAHSFSGSETSGPTCTEAAVDTYSCSCGASYTAAGRAALGHDTANAVRVYTTDLANNQTGTFAYQCPRCNYYLSSSYNSETQEWEVSEEGASASAAGKTSQVSAPQFSSFIDRSIVSGYNNAGAVYMDYSRKAASLRLESTALPEVKNEDYKQAVRFAGSVRVPDGVSFADNYANFMSKVINPATNKVKTLSQLQALETDTSIDNCILDFGYVYTQEVVSSTEDFSWDRFVLEEDGVYRMSVVSNNATAAGYSSWKGYTAHTVDEAYQASISNESLQTGTYLTYNLLINVKAKNWHKMYHGRTYIIYKYQGKIYTVYDSIYQTVNGVQSLHISQRSVLGYADYAYDLYAEQGYATNEIAVYLNNRINYWCNNFLTEYNEERAAKGLEAVTAETIRETVRKEIYLKEYGIDLDA